MRILCRKPARRALYKKGVSREFTDHDVEEKAQPVCTAGTRKVFNDLIDREQILNSGVNTIMIGAKKDVALGARREDRRH